MKTVKEAQAIILEHVSVLKAENVPIESSLGRILAEDVSSNRNHPPYDMSAMDGYAVRHVDIKNAAKASPAILSIVDDIRAGVEPICAIKSNEASRIMTGAAVPEGADTIVRVEDTDCDGTKVKIFVPASKGTDIRRLGENLRKGDLVLSRGIDIGAAQLGILAMVKKAAVPVHRKPKIAIISTGDELEGLTEKFNERKIPDANSYTAMAQALSAGAEPVILGIAGDSKEALRKKLLEGLEYDGLIVSGGVSVGHHDFVRPTLNELGIDMLFWRVAMRPGHPFAFGLRGKTPVFALPGNPVSSMVCFEEFITPAIRKMVGAGAVFRKTIKARLTEDVSDKRGRVHFMRVVLEYTPDGYSARLTGSQGSAILMSMAAAHGLLVMPSHSEILKKDSIATVQLLNYSSGPSGFQHESDIPEEEA